MRIRFKLRLRILVIAAVILFSQNILTLEIKISGDYAPEGKLALDNTCKLFSENSFTSDAKLTKYTSEQSYSGDKSLKLTVNQGTTGFGDFGGMIDFKKCLKDANFSLGKGDEIWMRVRLFIPQDWEFNSGRNKFMRLRTTKGFLDLYLSGNEALETPIHFIYEGEQKWERYGSFSKHLPREKWVTYEVYYSLDDKPFSEGGKGVVRVWVDGRLVGEALNRKTLANDNVTLHSFLLFTWFGNEKSPKTQSLYVDDLFITTKRPSEFDEYGHAFIGL